MVQARGQHPNAVLTPQGRRRMVGCVLEGGWTVEATAERFQVDAKTVRKWRDRYLREGVDGLGDRSSRPRSSPRQTRRSCQRRVVSLRRRRRWGAARIAAEVGIATSTAQSILNAAGLGRLNRGDRASVAVKPRRYQRDRPGELVHVDVKKLSRIPAGGGWRAHGWGQVSRTRTARVGYAYIHTAIDDRTRLAYSEILHDEQGPTAAMFWARAMAYFAMQVREAIIMHKALKNPNELGFETLHRAPLLGCYLLIGASDSELIAMLWDEFGQAGWMDEVTRLLKDLKPLMDQAADLIQTSPFKLTGVPTRRSTSLSTFGKAKYLASWLA